MKDFQNKVAVVTGAASGIGKGLAQKCVQEKMKVVIADINQTNLQNTEQELKKEGGDVLAVVTDVSKRSAIENLAKKTMDHFGDIHILFNNAGVTGPIGPIWEEDIDDFKKVIDINLMSVVYGLRTFVPIMLEQNHECHIVNTASAAGFGTALYVSGYAATKFAVVALSEVLFLDLTQRKGNINVSVLCPSMVATNIARDLSAKPTSTDHEKACMELFKRSVDYIGIQPAQVAEQTFKAIEDKQFYILTHFDEQKSVIKERMKNIIECRDPS